VVRALHRISAGYGVLALVVPVFGIATAARMGVQGQVRVWVWVWVSIVLTALAALLLAVGIVSGQRRVLQGLDADPPQSSDTDNDSARGPEPAPRRALLLVVQGVRDVE